MILKQYQAEINTFIHCDSHWRYKLGNVVGYDDYNCIWTRSAVEPHDWKFATIHFSRIGACLISSDNVYVWKINKAIFKGLGPIAFYVQL